MRNIYFIILAIGIVMGGCNSTDTTTTDQHGFEETDGTGIPDIPAQKITQTGWYLRTVVTATLPDGRRFTHKSAGVFGELNDSVSGKDPHDIPSYGRAVLHVRFVNDNIDPEGEFFSDYRQYDGTNKKESWTFLVKNEYTTQIAPVNLANASLKIEVEPMRNVFLKEGESRFFEKYADGKEDKRYHLTLIDLDNQKTYSYEELLHTTLGMDGKHTRSFRWVLGDMNENDMQPLSVSFVQKSALPFEAKRTKPNSKFGLPPE